MTADQVMKELKAFGNNQTKKVFKNHGAREPFYGVKVGDMKTIQKKIKKDHKLALELYDTGNSDAMYFAGLIADENVITKKQLQKWVKKAYWYMISEYTVPWIAAESKYGWELGLEWIESKNESIASSGWATLLNVVSIKDDIELDVRQIEKLIKRVEKEIHSAPNRVRYTMNGFVISAGCYVSELTEKALAAGNKIGKVSVDLGNTACKVPFAKDYIQKVKSRGTIGKKRKMARC